MQKFFLVTSFFLIPIILIAQTDDIDGKLKAQEEQQKLEDEKIFLDTSKTIKLAIQNIYKKNSMKTQISKTAFEIALKQLI